MLQLEQNEQPPVYEHEKKRIRISSIAATLALVITLGICLVFLVSVLTVGYVSIFGVSVFRVVTPSMEPTIPVDALLICRETPIEEVKLNDIICFRSRDPAMLGRVITHRVIGVTDREDGVRLLETRGDANPAPDSYLVTQANLVGKVTWHTKGANFMASIVAVFNNKIGFLACIVFPCLLIAGFVLRNSIRNIRSQLDAVTAQLKESNNARSHTDEIPGSPPEEITPEEYREMYEKIRAELIEELKLGAMDEAVDTAETESGDAGADGPAGHA